MRTPPRAHFGKARTPTEARRAAPRLCFYIQDNDVHGGVRKRAAALHRFLGLSLRSCFAPVVCLQHTRSRVYVSAKRERQRNSGQPVLRWRFYIQDNIIRKTLCVCSVMFSWTFAVAPLAAAPRLLEGRSVGKALPHFHNEPYARCAV